MNGIFNYHECRPGVTSKEINYYSSENNLKIYPVEFQIIIHGYKPVTMKNFTNDF